MSISKKSKERRKARHERNARRDKEHKTQAWDSGRLIEENHNSGPYSQDYTDALATRLVQYLSEGSKGRTPEEFVKVFWMYKAKIQDLILYWNPSQPQDQRYEFLKTILEVYWDEVLENKNLEALHQCCTRMT